MEWLQLLAIVYYIIFNWTQTQWFFWMFNRNSMREYKCKFIKNYFYFVFQINAKIFFLNVNLKPVLSRTKNRKRAHVYAIVSVERYPIQQLSPEEMTVVCKENKLKSCKLLEQSYREK